jgi:tetratricopeptide (TPR) repeat protein
VPVELALIARKALEKRREDRYVSMREFEQDLRRYLANQPIRARPPSLPRRTQKWVLRHPTASATIAISVCAFGLLLALTLRAERLRREAEKQTAVARTEAALSQEVEDFLTGLFQSADPALYGVDEPTLRDVIERGRARLLAGEVENPEVRARLATTLSNILGKLGAFPEASELLEGAATAWEDLSREEDPDALDTRLQQAVAAYDDGRDPDAMAILDELRERGREGHLDPRTECSVERMRAEVFSRQGRFAEAEAAFDRADELGREHLEEGCDELTILRTRRGELLYRQRRFAEVEDLLAVDDERLAPLLASGNALALDHFNLLALTWLGQNRLAEARDLLERIVEASEEHLGKEHARSINTRINLATVLEQQGDLERAESMYAEAWETSEARYGSTSSEASTARNNFANCLLRQGRFTEAEPIIRDLLADMREIQGEHHLLTTRTRESLAHCLMQLGQSEEAVELIERALADLPPDAPERPALEAALEKLYAETPSDDTESATSEE